MTDIVPQVLGRPAELMLVEDNDGDLLLVQEAFKSSKIAYRLHIARDGKQALEMLRKVPPYGEAVTPDVILLDLNLPRVDGREVLAEIKSTPALAKIPVVILSGSRAELDIVHCYELNANCYIAKPNDFAQLQNVVTTIQNFWFDIVLLQANDPKRLFPDGPKPASWDSGFEQGSTPTAVNCLISTNPHNLIAIYQTLSPAV